MWDFLGKLTTGQVSLIIVCLLIIALTMILVFGPDLVRLARDRWTKNDEQKTMIDVVLKNIEGVKELVETQIKQQNKTIEDQGEQISEIADAVKEVAAKLDAGFSDLRAGFAAHIEDHRQGVATSLEWDGNERRRVPRPQNSEKAEG